MRAIRGERRREERRLGVLGERFEDRVEFVRKAQVEHFVGFVEDDRADVAKLQGPLFDVVQRAARRGDDGVGAALQGADLAAVLLPAVDRRHEHARVAAVVVERFAHLKAEFTRGREDEKHGVFGFGADHVALEERERKGGGLPGAGGGLAQHVGAGKERGDRGFLNGGGFFKAHLRERRDEVFGESEFGEGGH